MDLNYNINELDTLQITVFINTITIIRISVQIFHWVLFCDFPWQTDGLQQKTQQREIRMSWH